MAPAIDAVALPIERPHDVIVLSGGQDSTTVALHARSLRRVLHPIFFNYGQRHLNREFQAFKEIVSLLRRDGTVPQEEEPVVVGLPPSVFLSGFSELTSGTKLEGSSLGVATGGSLPNTFVPGRNLFFLMRAALYAVELRTRLGLSYLPQVLTGVCETDYSGYPDCRASTLKALAEALTLGLGAGEVRIMAPLMYLSKKDTVRLAATCSPDLWKEALSLTWTCYAGGEIPCGKCAACLLRIKGFTLAGVEDPALGSR